MTKEQIIYERFLELQQEAHEKNQKKIRVGLKINILLPLIFLAISFLSNRSKLVFLVLWIVSLFGISFYLLYVEYMDFKIQEQLKEVGIIEEEAETQALIGAEVLQSMDEINNVRTEVEKNLKDIKDGLKTDIRNVGDKLKK